MAIQNFSLASMDGILIKTYYIPEYQRNYAWSENELNDFLNDILDISIEGNTGNHFFGQLVIHNDNINNKKYIVDGQQRIITSVCFIKAIKQICDDMKLDIDDEELRESISDISSDIKTKYIGRISSRKNDAHLILQKSDRIFFEENIQKGTIKEEYETNSNSQKNLITALQFFYTNIKELLNKYDEYENKFNFLQTILNDFLTNTSVVYLESTDESEACTIFETLNARGKNLTQADLIKNYIIRNHIDEANEKWKKISDNVGESFLTQFINYYFRSKFKFIQQKDLYKYLTQVAENKEQINDMTNDLVKLSSYYHTMKHPNDRSMFSNRHILKSLETLNMIKVTVFYPIIFAMVDSGCFSENDIEKVTNCIEIYAIRNMVICKRNTNLVEKPFSEIAIDIFKKKIETPSQIISRINEANVTDQEFKNSFITWCGSSSSQNIIRYILSSINGYIDKNNELNTDNNRVHIEHIMPRNNSIWKVQKEIHEKYLWRLGNLTLLGSGFNESISNRHFSEKKDKYKQSLIKLNEYICNFNFWNETTIEERSTYLADIACCVWKS